MHRKDYRSKKAGVALLDLTAGDVHQGDLFSGIDPRSAKLMEVLAATNRKFGRGSMGLPRLRGARIGKLFKSRPGL